MTKYEYCVMIFETRWEEDGQGKNFEKRLVDLSAVVGFFLNDMKMVHT